MAKKMPHNLLFCSFDVLFSTPLKIGYFSISSLKVLLCSWYLSCTFPEFQIYVWGQAKRSLISVSSSYGIPLGELCPLVELPGFTEQGFSIPPPSCIASKKPPNNFPLVQRGRNSRHLFVLQLFSHCMLEMESSRIDESLESWIEHIK